MIRRALPGDRARVVATVTAAFAEDPAWTFLMGDEYERLAHHFAAALFDLRVPFGEVWVSDDVATVAMWDGPKWGAERSRLAREIWSRYSRLAGERSYRRHVLYNQSVAAAAPATPFWYLGVLATDPARRREGLASAVLAPALAAADSEGIPCCLETSTEGNRRFYERRGFTESSDIDLPGGPATWWLRRSAARRASPDRTDLG